MGFTTSFPPRMPTPPREDDTDLNSTVDDAVRYLDSSLISPPKGQTTRHIPASQSSLSTPPTSSPIQSLVDPKPREHKRAQRLRFSAETSLCEAEIKSLPPSKDQNPTRSILKTCEPPHQSSTTDAASRSPAAAYGTGDFGAMLESMVKQLAGQDYTSQIDAYSTLSTSIKAHQDHPGTEALLEKLSLLEQFMKRDVGSIPNSPFNNKLKLQALQLASTLIWKLPPALDGRVPSSRGVSNDFVSFIVKQCIRILEDQATPKELLRHHLVILTMAEIHRTKTIHAERAARLIKSLHSAHERFPGKSIVHLRLMICRQVAQYHPDIIADNIDGVLPYILHGLCSSEKETRARAIETGITVGTHAGNRKRVSHSLRDNMHSIASEHGRYVVHFENRLNHLTKSSDGSLHVPQIWGLIMLMLRGDSTLLLQWLTRKSWLKVIEFYFNSSDVGLNLHAWEAWNRTIYSTQRLMIEHEVVLKRLCQPVFGTLHRKSSCESTLSAFSSYYLILYYAFGQKLRPSKIQACWERLVGEMSRKLPGKNTGDGLRFAQALRALFADSSLKVWNSERGLHALKNPMKWEDIPKLDPSWIRQHISLVLNTAEPLLSDLQSPVSTSITGNVWTSMMKAISQAGEKEIKASSEFRAAVAVVVNYLRRFWYSKRIGRDTREDSRTTHIAAFLRLVQSSVEILGAMHWSEEFLHRAQDGTFEAGTTPSKTALQSQPRSQLCSPIASIVGLLWQPPPHSVISPALRSELSGILTTCLETKPTCGLKVDLLYDCMQSLASPEDSSVRPIIAHIWQILAHLSNSATRRVSSSLGYTGLDWSHYGKLLHILRFGLYFSDFKSFEVGRQLFQNISVLAKEEIGDAGFLVAVVEPWLDILTTANADTVDNNSAILKYMSLFLDHDFPAPSEKAIERTRNVIKVVNRELAPPKSNDLPEALLSIITQGLSISYAKLEALDSSAVDTFLISARKYFKSLKDQSLADTRSLESFVARLQPGVLLWIQDKDDKITKCRSRGYNIEQSFHQLWERLLNVISRLPSASNRLVSTLEDLLIAGLRSHSKKVANLTIAGWNQIFENHNSLECSEHMRTVLTRLRAYADVKIPLQTYQSDKAKDCDDWPPQDGQLFGWLDDETSKTVYYSQVNSALVHHPSVATYRTAFGSVSSPASKNSTPSRAARKDTSPPRPRHDNSQLQFVAIDLSPIVFPSDTNNDILTEHQKDVRSRQVAENNLFTNLRSSPIRDLPANEDGPMGKLIASRVDESDNQMVESELDQMEGILYSDDAQPVPLIHGDISKIIHSSNFEQPVEPVVSDGKTFVDAGFDTDIAVIEDTIHGRPEFDSLFEPNAAAPATSILEESLLIEDSTVQYVDLDVSRQSKLPQEIEYVEESYIEIISTPKPPGRLRILRSSSQTTQSQEASPKSRRDRKSLPTAGKSKEDEWSRSSPAGSNSQDAQEADVEAEGDTIVVEEPDDSSPSFKDVLESLGIAVPSAGASQNSQFSPRSARQSQPKRKRQSSETNEEKGEDDEKGSNTKKRRRSNKLSSSQQSAPGASPRHDSSGSQAQPESLFNRLKDIIGEVKELERDKLDNRARLDLIELGAQLHRQIEAIV